MTGPGEGRAAADDESVGSAADEAAKLLGALGGWARDHGAGLAAGLGPETDGPHPDTGAPECRWCPMCRTVHALRHLDPEIIEQLAVAGAALLRAGAGLAAALTADPPGHTTEGPGSADGPDGTDARP